MAINIAGTVHAVARIGRTACGQTYPGSWRTTRKDIDCAACDRRLKSDYAEQEATNKAEWEARVAQYAGMPDIPFD